jgi:hypothetical protein
VRTQTYVCVHICSNRGQTHTILQVASCHHELDGMGSSCWPRTSRAGGAQRERRERASEGESESESESMRERARAKSKRERYTESARQKRSESLLLS